MEFLRIGNAQGFWGDRNQAAALLLQGEPRLNFVTMDYLAEVSMSLLAMQREKDKNLGYALDFLDALELLIPFWKAGNPFKLITNAGGLNPKGLAVSVKKRLDESGLKKLIGVVSGDDVLSQIIDYADKPDSLVTANAYFGAAPIAKALDQGADIVITGRVADPSLTVSCCMHHFKWSKTGYDQVATATVAGHLIECGTQVTGGILTNWLSVTDPAYMGYPIIEIEENGTFVVTKPKNTGGCVTEETVKEQLLYEIGDPDAYLSPDVTVSFLNLQLENAGKDRIRITGAKGRKPPPTYKVSATYKDGYMAEGMLTLFGRDVVKKGYRLAEIVFERVKSQGYSLKRTYAECIGSGDVVPGVLPKIAKQHLTECVLRLAAHDGRKEAIVCFSKELAPLITSGAQGVTGYQAGRPKVRSVFGYWPCFIEKELVKPLVEIF